MKTMRTQTVVRAALLTVVLFGFELFLVFGAGPMGNHQDLSHWLTDAAAWHLPSVRPDMDQLLSAMGR